MTQRKEGKHGKEDYKFFVYGFSIIDDVNCVLSTKNGNQFKN